MKIIINENQLRNIINEGSIRLTYKERQQVEKMLPNIIKVIKGEDLGEGNFKKIGVISGQSANGNNWLETTIYVGVNIEESNNSIGYFKRNTRWDLRDNIIVIQQRKYARYFKDASKYDYDKEMLRKTLVHELIHSKDPAINQFGKEDEKYGYDEETYFGSIIEFVAMTGQFFEAILAGVDSSYRLKRTKEQIMDALNNILMVYSGKERIFNQNANNFIQGSNDKKVFQDMISNDADDNFSMYIEYTAIDKYASYLKMIKKYNPKEYNKFLRELYKTINEAKDKTKQLYNLGNKKITIKGDNLEDLKMQFRYTYENEFIDPKSIEFDINNYTISFKPGNTKAKTMHLDFEYADSDNPNLVKRFSIEERAKMVASNFQSYVMLKKDLTNPILKWFIYIEV